MNDLQEHASPYPPFQSVPMPVNTKEAHFILALALIMWTAGFMLIFRLGRKNK